MFFYISVIISLIGLIIATYTDLKERIVTNKLNFSLAILGLIMYSIQSIIDLTIYPILFSIFGLIFGFSFAWVLWKVGVFAGGDVKLFMGLGALNPFTPALLKIGLLTNSNLPIFPITLFLYSLIAFLPYAIFVLITKMISKEKERKIIIKEFKKNILKSLEIAILIAFIHLIFTLFFNSLILVEILSIIILSFLINKLNSKILYLLEGIILIISAILNLEIFLQYFFLSASVLIVGYGIIKLLLSSRILLVESIKISELKEGMIPQKSLIKKGNKVIEVEGLSINKIIEYSLSGKITEILNEKKQIISANKARGLTIEEIKELKKLLKQKKIKNIINIKESMPFVPTILISYILCLLIGDLIINLMVVL